MFSLIKHVYNLLDYDYQKNLYAKKFEEETEHFDEELENEKVIEEEKVVEKKPAEEEVACSQRTGVITSLRTNNGIIDNSIFFDSSAAPFFHDFKVGATVEYLAYQNVQSDHLRVVKVEMTQDNLWDEDDKTEEQIRETLESLKLNDPKYFNTHQRSILGLIVSRNRQFLTIDTDYKEIIVDLDAVNIEFIPKEGDRVYLNCNVQTDENFVDLAGEILETKSVHPARTKREEGVVTKLHEDWGVFNNDSYFTMDTIDNKIKLSEGDVISAELIECERGIFLWRCLSIEILERAEIKPKTEPAKPPSESNKNMPQVITITDNIRFNFEKAFETQELKIEIKNNSERLHKILRMDFTGMRRNSQLKLDETLCPMQLEPGKSTTLTLHCESRFFGLTKEKLIFTFPNFKIFRNIEISVGVEERGSNKENTENRFNPNKSRSRHYANQVWSKKKEIIPGVRTHVMRRFIANRIPAFEVPLKLRNALLVDCPRAEQISNLDNLYPVLSKDLDIRNYTNRFQTLLFIEEIEHFVNFRQFDRERAHFARDGEYLALTIENLAEKRPSLVVGDTVRATNPWAEEDDNRAYDGCIHKVLFNRILVKFNPSFQNKYNGEDYRLEFYFSRYSFRKQHFGVQKIVSNRGEHFLFPSKIALSDNLQVNADIDDDGNLLIDNELAPKQWCNTNLNLIQKKAVKEVLRGEARIMPYVIFGPPGTGKTITLIETILQILITMPNSRILVGTPSNSAADLISTRLIDSGILNPGDFVRLVAQRLIEKEIIPDHLKQYCATIDIAVDGSTKDSMTVTESGLKLRCQMKYLGRHKITISTCATLSNFIQMDFPKNHFTHLLIDESGQCTEPEIVTTMCLLTQNSGQIILAGDPLQLGPIVVNNFAGDRGLRLSFLERLTSRFPYRKDKLRFPNTGYDPRLVTKLVYNYRALPSILESYSSLFYDSELLPQLAEQGNKEFDILETVRDLLPPSEIRSKTHAAFFHGIRGINKQDADSPSWYNPVEAKHIFLMTIQLYRLNIKPDQIAIITPYLKQVKIFRTLFAEADVAMPKIGTVEEFQGQERDIVLISTVRSSSDLIKVDLKYAIGFACSPKRMNVAISRARALLYICGNPHLLSHTDKWSDFIKYCVDNDAYLGCDLPEKIAPLNSKPSSSNKKQED
ncbi:probable RNA helicase armi [Episyrphus balteatus]|uniref:probable RNA helicase armi n=1 Tax=Episyrphus balteatus TaxID=286459 RepID=UPI002485EC8D|nr:probable RNA helicase armi [Episyrphus balteatus]